MPCCEADRGRAEGFSVSPFPKLPSAQNNPYCHIGVFWGDIRMPFGMLREEGAVSEMGSQTSGGVVVLLSARDHMQC